MDWFIEASKDYIPGVFGYKKIAKKYNVELKTVESRFLAAKKRGDIKEPGVELDLNSSILKDLSRECTISQLCERYKQSERVISAILEDIKEDGFILSETNGR